jgi:hypothetical protein
MHYFSSVVNSLLHQVWSHFHSDSLKSKHNSYFFHYFPPFLFSVTKLWATQIRFNSNRGDQLDEVQEPHCRRQLRPDPCINKIKFFLLIWWLLVSVHPITLGLLSSESILQRHSRPALCICVPPDYFLRGNCTIRTSDVMWTTAVQCSLISCIFVVIRVTSY